ncbi:MAG: hypothetical protein IVW36_03790 [Dehalococcoidia bacterium]|nr:hypothetical protein [Dehalococcoidia bacterium]
MKIKHPAAITDIEDAAAVRWLALALARARAEARRTPDDDAIDRIRAAVFGVERPKQRERIAA